MEETVANIQLEMNDLHHVDITPNQCICKEIKNVSVMAEEITENPEYVVMHRSIAVQAVTNEEVVIPKQDLTLNQASNLTDVSSECGNTMEIDISSQESVMEIASQESVSVKESNSEEPHYCNHRVTASFDEIDVLQEEDVQKKKEAVLESMGRLKILEEDIANRKRILLQTEMEIQENQEMLNIQEQQIADRELTLKKLDTAIKIRELEAEGYKVIPLTQSNGSGCLPAKRAKKT